jgi:hypothetical protein
MGECMMNRIDTFLSCLKHWDETTENKIESLDGITFHLGHALGIREKLSVELQDIYERIIYLTKEEKIKEKFLIYSLISEVDLLLERSINFLGEAIITNEQISSSYIEEYGLVPEHVEKGLLNMKDKSNLFKAEMQLDNWRKIKHTHFTLLNERIWESEDLQKLGK